ncbi:MAG: hypothetical protein AB1772_03030 [Candidatus Zixiibacteriota bacterium]
MNVPSHNFLSAPLWLINVLHIVTLSLHLIAMNFLFGGLAVILLGRIKQRWQNPAVLRYVKLLPTAMAATITLGVAPLLFLQLVYHRQAYSAGIVSGWFWLFIIPVVILAYYFLYGAAFTKTPEKHNGRYLLVSLLCFVYVSLVYSTVFALAENPELCRTAYAANPGGLTINPDIGSWIFRWLHMITGAITVGGLFVGWVGKDDDAVYRTGKLFFTWGFATASVFGMIYLFTLGEHLLGLMRTPAIWALTVGIVLSAGSLHFFYKRRFVWAGIMVMLSVLMMVYTRHHVRLLHLADEFEPSTLPIRTQWSIFLVFLVCFVAALGLVWYMLKLFFAREQNQ